MQKQKREKVLDVWIDLISREDVLTRVKNDLANKKVCQIATCNPEFLLCARENERFKKVLDETELNLIDGFGIELVLRKRGMKNIERIAGAGLIYDLFNLAEKENRQIFLIINKKGLSSLAEIKKSILEKYSSLKVDGIEIDKNNSQKTLKKVLKENYKNKIILCNSGALYQEIILSEIKQKLIKSNSGGVLIGVGGAFDFLTGKIKRAPRFMRALGLEWLWRLSRQPVKRIKRIWRATVVFFLRTLRH